MDGATAQASFPLCALITPAIVDIRPHHHPNLTSGPWPQHEVTRNFTATTPRHGISGVTRRQARFSDAEIRHRDLEHRQRVHYIHQLYGPPPDLQRIHDHGHEQAYWRAAFRRSRPRGHHGDSDDEIIEVVSLGSDGGFDDHHHHPRHESLSIEQDRDRGRVLRDLMGKEVKRGKSKGQARQGKEGPARRKGRASPTTTTATPAMMKRKSSWRASRPESESVANEVGSHGHGGGSDRGSPRTRRRFVREVESDDSMDFRPRRQSRSRGRLGWGL